MKLSLSNRQILLATFVLATSLIATAYSLISASFVVRLTSLGFVPDVLAIPVGSRLTWINEDSSPHWPASNVHPTHALYPESGGCIGSKLDACKGLKKGESFSFTFNITGQWPMHDHLQPGSTMVVIVGQAKDEFQHNEIPPAKEFKALDYVRQQRIIKELSRKNPQVAWQYLKSALIVNDEVVGDGHEFAHIIGNEAYKQQGLRAVSICDASFAYGCFHGVTEQMLQEQGAGIVASVQQECTRLFPRGISQNFTGCIHGMGHGLLTWEHLNVPFALKDCDKLEQNNKGYCYDGVFMEYALGSPIDRVNVNKPWSFCLDLSLPYHYNCGRYESQLLQHLGLDFVQTAAACESAPEDILRKTCFEDLGYQTTQKTHGEVQAVQLQCGKIASFEGQQLCVTGAAREVIFQAYQDWRTRSQALCETLAGNWRTNCLNSNQQTMTIYRRS